MDILKSFQLVIFSHSTIFITFSYRSLAGFLFKLYEVRGGENRKWRWIFAFDRCVIIWSMAAILRDSTVVVVVVRTRPRAIPLAMITMRKSTHGFPFVPHMSMGLRLAAWPPELRYYVRSTPFLAGPKPLKMYGKAV